MTVIAVTEGQTLAPHTTTLLLLLLVLGPLGLGVAGRRLSEAMLLLAVASRMSTVRRISIIGRRNTEGIGQDIISILTSSSIPCLIIATMLSSSFPISIMPTGLTSSVADISVVSSRC